MLISICQDVVEEGHSNASFNHIYAIDVIRKLLMCVKWRKHIVYAPDMKEKDIDSYRSILSKDEVNTLAYIYSKRQKMHDILNKLSIYAEVTFIDQKQSNNCIIINPKTHRSFELYEETHFIVENIFDALFYSKVVYKYFQKQQLKNDFFSVAYYPVQGGGSTISDVIKHEFNISQHFCFIISDSDKKYEEAKIGETAMGITNVFKDFSNPFHSGYYIMNKTCEIENLIPICILKDHSNSSQNVFLNNYGNILSFFDIKAGLQYKILYDDDVCCEFMKIFPNNIDWNLIKTYKQQSRDFTEFSEKVGAIPKVVEAWGKNILKDIMCIPQKGGKSKSYMIYNIKEEDLTYNQKVEWDNIGQLFFSWCCCFSNPPI